MLPVAWPSLGPYHMRLSSYPESAAPRRGRRIVIALLILLLIGLPLYLWPLRGGVTGPPGAAALSGAPRDPRDAAAVAKLPPDVWEGLMGRGTEAGPKPGNLTRIAQLDEFPAAGPFDIGAVGGTLPGLHDTLPRGRAIGALVDDESDLSGGQSGTGDSPSGPVQFLAGPPADGGTGSGDPWGGGGYSGFPGSLGPFGDGGPHGPSGPAPILIGDPGIGDPGDPSVPTPTPEPTTILLVGSNLVLGAAAWKRLRRGREDTEPSG